MLIDRRILFNYSNPAVLLGRDGVLDDDGAIGGAPLVLMLRQR